MRVSFLPVFAAAAAIVVTATPAAPAAAQHSPREKQVEALLKSLETGDAKAASVIDAKTYRQHNLNVADGPAAFRSLVRSGPKSGVRVQTVRLFEDGDFVFAHSIYERGGPKVGFDIFRFDKGKIVEHWDNLQSNAGPNPSGHSMVDGPTAATDPALTAQNKALVRDFVDDILVNGRMDRIGIYIVADRYTQHNPQIGDGLSGLGTALEAMAKAGVTMKYDDTHHVLGDGNLVLTTSDGTFAGKPTAFYDLFRVEGGKIVEHWDTIQAIPAKAEWANPNGKF